MTMLEIRDLSVEYRTETGGLRAVNDVNLDIEEGEIVGLVGESGCGKTTVSKAILGLLPSNGEIVEGQINYNDTNLAALSERDLKPIRWNDISYILQNAMNAFDPVHTIKSQFVEVIRTHTDLSRREARERTKEILERVEIEPSRMNNYPHEFSGGQLQRLMIALALTLNPDLVLADEPTTGLDVIIQNEILDLIKEFQSDLGNAMLIITHDISVVAEIADRAAVMYAGEIVEHGGTDDIFNQNTHPYTMGLLNAFPSISSTRQELVSIPGSPPDLHSPPSGCSFAPRCPFSTGKCETDPPLEQVRDNQWAKCHYTKEADEFRDRSNSASTWRATKNEY